MRLDFYQHNLGAPDKGSFQDQTKQGANDGRPNVLLRSGGLCQRVHRR